LVESPLYILLKTIPILDGKITCFKSEVLIPVYASTSETEDVILRFSMTNVPLGQAFEGVFVLAYLGMGQTVKSNFSPNGWFKDV
jgi:hypothetical protein